VKKINIALCGFGTVGRGVYEILRKNGSVLKRRTGLDFKIKKVLVKDINKKRGVAEEEICFTDNFNDIIEDSSVDIVVELIGGTDSAKKIIEASLEKGKPVVTANKALLALYGFDLAKSAEQNGADIFYEASVAGGIPIIKVFKESLASNEINYFYGILNGTSNYILTKMSSFGESFQKVLKDAQDKGYAESDPFLDVEGVDAAHKLAILISLAYDVKIDFNDIYIEGISKITEEDIKFANEFGYSVKLLAIAKKTDNLIEGRVHPVLIKKDSILANINGVYNAVYVMGDFMGPSLFFGKGAGSFPTASSVFSDIIDAALNISKSSLLRRPVFTSSVDKMTSVGLKPMSELKTKYYLRFYAQDKPGVLSKISGVLGEHSISLEAVIQKGREGDVNCNGAVPIVMITHESLEKNIVDAVNIIKSLDIVKEKTYFIRIEDF